MQRSIADHAPLLAGDVVCHTCGNILKPQVIQGARGGVQCVRYECRNKEHGCSYATETNVYLASELFPVRPDGKAAK